MIPSAYLDGYIQQIIPNSSDSKKMEYRISNEVKHLASNLDDGDSRSKLARLGECVIKGGKKRTSSASGSFPDSTLWLVVTAGIRIDRVDLTTGAIELSKHFPAEGHKEVAQLASEHGTSDMRIWSDSHLDYSRVRCGR